MDEDHRITIVIVMLGEGQGMAVIRLVNGG